MNVYKCHVSVVRWVGVREESILMPVMVIFGRDRTIGVVSIGSAVSVGSAVSIMSVIKIGS